MRDPATSPLGNPDPGVSFAAGYADFRARFLDRAPLRLERETGDHVFNPDLPPYAMWEGPPRDAAVLIPLRQLRGEAHVILTQRTPHLRSHAGQIAFPGGKIDAEDAGPRAAALREAHEEIGLSPQAVSILGDLAPYHTGSGYRIVPVVAEVAEDAALVANPAEVADVFEVPLPFLMDPANHRKQSRSWQGRERFFYEMPYGERYIWGVTAGILRSLFETVYG